MAIFKRMGNVFELKERKPLEDFSSELKAKKLRVDISNANLSWGFKLLKSGQIDKKSKPDINLSNINLRVSEGELACIVGQVGSGKSTLLAGIRNELEILNGTVKTYGKIAYVEQEPCIISGTVRENI